MVGTISGKDSEGGSVDNKNTKFLKSMLRKVEAMESRLLNIRQGHLRVVKGTFPHLAREMMDLLAMSKEVKNSLVSELTTKREVEPPSQRLLRKAPSISLAKRGAQSS